MVNIRTDAQICTVVVTVDAGEREMSDLVAHARAGLDAFKTMPGFIAGALHKSTDGQRIIQYLQWRSEADHLTCINDPRWDAVPSAQRFMSIVRSGRAKMDVRTYHVIHATANSGGPDGSGGG